MNFELFCKSVKTRNKLKGLPAPLHALWLDGNGEWEKAHECIQDAGDAASALVHAYLHRKEGDLWNARYWYKNAGRRPFEGSLEMEWESLVRELLGESSIQTEAR